MKTRYFYPLLIVLSAAKITVLGQNIDNTITISGNKLTQPIVEKWISEYSKANPEIKFKLLTKTSNNDNREVDINVIAHQPSENEIQHNQDIVYAGKYALLPVTNKNNPVLLSKKNYGKKDIDKLFFEVINYDEDPVPEKVKVRANIYSSDNQSSSAKVLSGYFGHIPSELRGKKIVGGENYLLTAIKKDSIGLTYNNLGYVFDNTSRNIVDGISIFPVDLKKENKQLLIGNLDVVIAVLEKTKIETIPVEKIGLIYSHDKENKVVNNFLKWVLSEGQKFNHEKGFLNLDKELLSEQSTRLSERYLSLK